MLVVAKRFANQTFDPVAAHRAADDAGGDRQSKPGSGRAVVGARRSRTKHRRSVAHPDRRDRSRIFPETLRRSERPGESLQVRQRTSARRRRAQRSDSETLATLRAATGKHLTAGAGGHARTKAVSALTMNFAGLISALHAEISRRENCAKTSTWWVEKKGGKGTQRACGVSSTKRTCDDSCRKIARSRLWITRGAWV